MEFNLAQIHEAIAATIPERECLIYRDRRLTWAEVTDRTRRLANYLLTRGIGHHRERAELQDWESGQDHIALYMHNCNEYLESMLGAYKARSAPFNVNYRYVEEELIYLMRDSKARAVVYHANFAPMLDKIRSELPDLEVLIQVEDDSKHPLLEGAVEYEAALASVSADKPDVELSADDLYILYTGGTTGMPKGVLWRQADIYVAALGGRDRGDNEYTSIDPIIEHAKRGGKKTLPAPPMMHGAAHWAAFMNWQGGHTVVIQDHPERLDANDILSTIEREKIHGLLIVGDAFGRPLLDQLRRRSYNIASLRVLVTGGAALSASLKREFLELLPDIMIVDSVGSSESGGQAQNVSTKETGASTGVFRPGPQMCILSEDMTRVLEAGHEEMGWFAQRGRVPLGYLGDEEKSKRTFVTIKEHRYSVPGDRARLRSDGIVELYGRDSVTINSGGEKIFVEEVEHAIKHHAGIYDTIVVGRPSERWGQEVVAIVRVREGHQVSDADLLKECGKHLARYKHPKSFLFLDEIVRSPSGKPDYRWAKAQVS